MLVVFSYFLPYDTAGNDSLAYSVSGVTGNLIARKYYRCDNDFLGNFIAERNVFLGNIIAARKYDRSRYSRPVEARNNA